MPYLLLPMSFKTLDPNEVLKLIENQEDVLTPAHKIEDRFYAQFVCPKCGGTCERRMTANHMFSGRALLPKSTLKCSACSYHFDPHSGITVETGDWKLR